MAAERKKFNILLVSDFFFPRLGGVELHQFQIAQALIARGHKVVALTGTYGTSENPTQRQGIRYMTNGLKVYYTPQMHLYNQASPLTFYTFFPLFRQILIRERIDIVHGHQTTSALAHECILHAKTMGHKAIFTDHSLFGFSNAASIHINKIMKFTLADIDRVVCVSNTSKENLVLRACLDPRDVSVIPNAVDMTKFTPLPSAAPSARDQINIVILSRLVYRKGVDLVVKVVPVICRRFPNVHFIIGGDGHMRIDVEEMREQHQLHDQVELLGAVPHADVRKVLVRGHIFLNASLTEAFCIAILEAISCGLLVVSTNVGGIPEVLPDKLIHMVEPDPACIIEGLNDAIALVVSGQTASAERHQRVRGMYNWHTTAQRLEEVYETISRLPPLPLLDRLRRYHRCGVVAGKLFCILVAFDYLLWRFLEWADPRSEIDIAPDFPTETYTSVKDKL